MCSHVHTCAHKYGILPYHMVSNLNAKDFDCMIIKKIIVFS